MDLSKLPRMSDTRKAESERTRDEADAPAEAAPEEQRVPFSAESVGVSRQEHDHPLQYAPGRVVAVDAGSGAWISLIVGALLILFMPRWWLWLSHKLLGTGFTPPIITDEQGAPLAYEKSVFFPGEMAVALFALALLVEGVVLMSMAHRRGAIWFSLIIVAAATLFNLGYLGYMISKGYGIQLFSTLAVLFGAFMCVQQWQLLRGPRRKYLLVEEA